MITLDVLISGVFCFLISLLAHVIWWRIKRPKAQIQALVSLFLVFPLLGLTCLMQFFPLRDFWLSLALAYSFSFSYVLFYPAAQAVSPTLKLILIISKFSYSGCSAQELKKYFNTKDLLQERFDDLVQEGFLRTCHGKINITLRGRVFLSFFVALRVILGLEQGKG
ncbi:MAG: hypothetical protein MUF05_03740 [Candidatus Omnitrophica bacterium]|jgi:hypothetical protein|nr:hypothetical protein [Candidatus Omnitrophota bacterium]